MTVMDKLTIKGDSKQDTVWWELQCSVFNFQLTQTKWRLDKQWEKITSHTQHIVSAEHFMDCYTVTANSMLKYNEGYC